MIEQPHGLVVDELVEIALFLQERDDAFVAPHRPVMLRDHGIGPVAVAFDRLVEVARPQPAVANLRAAQGVEIVHVVGGVLRHVQDLELRKVHDHLRRRFGARHQMKLDLDAVDHAGLVSLPDQVVRRDQRDRAFRQRLAEAFIDLPAFIDRQRQAVHVLRAAAHGVAGDDVFRHRMLHESVRRDHLDLAGSGVLGRHHALGAAEMIDVAMGIDHGCNRPGGAVGEIEIERGLRGLVGQQGVDQDQAAIALDDGEIGEIETAHLVDAIGHLEQAMHGIELRLPPQAGIDGRRHRVLLQKRVRPQVPGRLAANARHHTIPERRDETTPGVVEIGAIGKRQRFHKGIVGRACRRFRVLGLC